MLPLLATFLTLALGAPQEASNLRTEYLSDPNLISLDKPPRFSWVPQSTARGATQSAYWLQVWLKSSPATPVWDSGKVVSSATNQVVYGGPALSHDSIYLWNVTWWDNAGAPSPTSTLASFGTDLDQSAWEQSQWIGCTGVAGPNANQLRVEFPVAPPAPGVTLTQARLYVSGLGWHVAYLNGQRLGRSVLEPAFTDLRTRVLYVAHDVTDLLSTASSNVVGVFLGHGWPDVLQPWGPNSGTGVPPWNGSTTHSVGGAVAPREGISREDLISLTQSQLDDLIRKGYGHGHTGWERRLNLILSYKWSDGTSGTLVSSADTMGSSAAAPAKAPTSSSSSASAPPSWTCGSGALLYDDLYGGCTIDASKATTGWLSPGYNFSTGTWGAAVRIAEPGGALYPATFPAVEVVGELTPRAMWQSPAGDFIWDLGQNFAGGVRLTLPGPTQPGMTIVVRHAEAVQHGMYGPKDGSLYFGNLRSAEATDTYITAGSEDGEVFEPMFTWHGFRYVQVTGLPFTPELTGVVTGINYRTAVPTVGNLVFPSSANTLNQLQHAIQWGQASNLMGNPSDCPQRDERLGWTGDSALTGEEASFNYDMSAFLSHWADTIDDSLALNKEDPTFKSGGLPETIPDITGGYDADASWSSVWPTTLHTVWKAYGDARIVETYWADLMLYVNHTVTLMKNNDINGIFNTWGDWCPPPSTFGGGQGPKPVPAFTAGVSFLNDLHAILEMATAIASPDLPALTALNARLSAQFVVDWGHGGAYFGSSPTDGAQTAQACALALGVVPASNTSTIVDYLVADIAAHDSHMAVGIIGTKFLHRALTANGHAWLAANISMQTEYPSFGWTFNHPDEPATTLWELWDGPTEGPGMNSRNHIMQGAIGAWLYTDVAGISQQPGSAGYSSILLAPKVTVHESLPYASGSLESIAGPISITWVNATATFSLKATIPCNTVAEVRVPFPAGAATGSLVGTEGGVAFFTAGAYVPGVPGITGAAVMGDALSVSVGAGSYSFILKGW